MKMEIILCPGFGGVWLHGVDFDFCLDGIQALNPQVGEKDYVKLIVSNRPGEGRQRVVLSFDCYGAFINGKYRPFVTDTARALRKHPLGRYAGDVLYVEAKIVKSDFEESGGAVKVAPSSSRPDSLLDTKTEA